MNKFHVHAFALTAATTVVPDPQRRRSRNEIRIPAANAQLAHAPATLTLNFSEAAQLAVLKLTASGIASTDRGSRGQALVRHRGALPALKPRYQVEWSAIAADDGHITKGSFSFAWCR